VYIITYLSNQCVVKDVQ